MVMYSPSPPEKRGGRVVRWCWVNFQCRGVLQFGFQWGWSGGAMVLGKLPVPGRPTIWISVGVVGWCDGAG